ncbi:uncharacterized protein LOC131306845 [Rhododendron vialii]|uniref:uncharacterized protein LOC131306845 n=1 Tax=Rhododendron vialii TaxID=182163 RepID=UPI00265EB7AE|nr:uncharacterized protein LOC131306845 [Rhododendron vialii]
MANKESIEALDDLLRDITDNDTFGQCSQKSSLVRSHIWPMLTKIKLKQNMRAWTDVAFSTYILRIGNGLEPKDHAGQIKLPSFLALQPTKAAPALDHLIEFVIPTISTTEFEQISLSNSAILTPKNDAVDEINELITAKFPGQDQLYLSFDQTTNKAQEGLYIDFINSLVPSGMPTHKLLLKKNILVLLLRNINPSKGLCNGTRLICKEFAKHIITAEITSGEKKGTTVFIPRIPLQPSDPQ